MAAVTITKDNVSKVFKDLRTLIGKQVLVGIPESRDARTDEDAPIGNAGIGYVMEFGSPAQNVPPRPFLIPGVQSVEKAAVVQLRKAADATLNGHPQEADQYLNAAGVVASNSVRERISSNIPPPLKPATIRARRYARKTQSRRESEEVYAGLIAQGVNPGAAQNEVGIVSLVNTGALRNSITYVVRQTDAGA